MELLISLTITGGLIGLILKWARDNARRDQQALESLRVLVEDNPKKIGRKAG